MTKNNFFPTGIHIQKKKNKIPLIFQNDFINSAIRREEKKAKLLNKFLSKNFGSNSYIFKKITENNIKPLNFNLFFKKKKDKFNVLIKNSFDKNNFNNIELFHKKNLVLPNCKNFSCDYYTERTNKKSFFLLK